MLRYLLDEHLRGPLWQAILIHNRRGIDPIDAVCVGDAADLPLGSTDPQILEWAEREARILLSFDRSTLPEHLATHLAAGRDSPGIFLIRRGIMSLGELVSNLALYAHASEPEEWSDRIEYFG